MMVGGAAAAGAVVVTEAIVQRAAVASSIHRLKLSPYIILYLQFRYNRRNPLFCFLNVSICSFGASAKLDDGILVFVLVECSKLYLGRVSLSENRFVSPGTVKLQNVAFFQAQLSLKFLEDPFNHALIDNFLKIEYSSHHSNTASAVLIC